jgi:hypothetical protein
MKTRGPTCSLKERSENNVSRAITVPLRPDFRALSSLVTGRPFDLRNELFQRQNGISRYDD